VKLKDRDPGIGSTEEAPLKYAAPALAVLILALSLSAQSGTGIVQGKVADKEGKPLADVRVTLSRPPASDLQVTAGEDGRFRFPAVPPGADYALKAELLDYKTVVRSGILVRTGGSVTIDLALEVGKPEEQDLAPAAVRAVDPRLPALKREFGPTILQTLPTVRDPWGIAQLVPGVLADRENIGGNESTGASRLIARGDSTNGAVNVWKIDGIDVTDPVDLGSPAIAFDFDALETVVVTVGGARDVTVPTGGIALNLLSRRGGDKIGAAARFYLTDNAFQGSNLTEELKNDGVSNTNRIEQIKDYGASAGGPIFKGRLWWWGSYGVRDIYNYTIYDLPDQALFSQYSFKLDARPIPGNRFEAQVLADSKVRYGADASPSRPEGFHQTTPYRLGNPVLMLQDEQAFGNDLNAYVKWTHASTGSSVRPAGDRDLAYPVTYDIAKEAYVPFSSSFGRSWESSEEHKKRKGLELQVSLFKDSLLGLSHEFKAGLEFADKSVLRQSGYFQNFTVRRNYVDPTFDLGEGLVVPPEGWQYISYGRENRDSLRLNQSSAYVQDTITKGRLTLTLGLRYDYQEPSMGAYGLATTLPSADAWKSVFSSLVVTTLGNLLPALTVDPVDPKYQWSTWSPRIGLAWDLKGDGRTMIKLSVAQYGDLMSAGAFTSKPLGLGGGLGFWWKDADDDNLVDYTEMFWKYSAAHPEFPNQLYPFLQENGVLTDEAVDTLLDGFEGDAYLAGNYWDFDWFNRGTVNYDYLTNFYRSDIDPDAKSVKTSPRTREVILSLEKEIGPDLTAAVAATYRRFDNFDWSKFFYPADIYPSTPDLVIDDSQAWYVQAGTVPSTITIGGTDYDLGDAAGKPWYLPGASFPGETPFRMVDKSGAYRTYFGIDLALTKRLSRRWFMNASLTLQDQRNHWNGSFIDPTNQWALDGQAYANVSSGANGKVSVQMYARWMAKVSALYQMPWGISVSATLQAREGWRIPHYITLGLADEESWDGLYRTNTVFLQTLSKDRLPTMRNLSFRLEKGLTLGTGRLTFMADVFNVFNSAIVNRANDAYLGVYYVDTEEGSAYPWNRLYNEILNPRVMRFGVRFEF
jgi:hypothetical protein